MSNCVLLFAILGILLLFMPHIHDIGRFLGGHLGGYLYGHLGFHRIWIEIVIFYTFYILFFHQIHK